MVAKNTSLSAQHMEHLRESEVYFRRIEPYLIERDLEEVRTAYAFSKYGHRNQMRDDGGRYFDHPKAVSLLIFDDFDIKFDWQVIVIALLHDIKEDQYILTERRIEINFKKIVAQGVKYVSKDEDNKAIFFTRLFACGQWRPIIVKLADRIHNMRTLDNCSVDKQQKQVKETRENYFTLCDVAEKLVPKKYRHAVTYARKELNKLCEKYES